MPHDIGSTFAGTRFELEDDAEDVRAGTRYVPFVPSAKTAWGQATSTAATRGRFVKLFIGLIQSSQQARRSAWSWRYEWLWPDLESAQSTMNEHQGRGLKVAVLEVPALLWVENRRHRLQLLGPPGLWIDAAVDRPTARMLQMATPQWAIHHPPAQRRARFWAHTLIPVRRPPD